MAVLFATTGGDLLAALVALFALAALFVRRKYTYWQQRGIPFARPQFPFGNFGDNFRQRLSFGDTIQKLYTENPGQRVLGIWSFLSPTLIVNDPELVREVCIKNAANFLDRGIYSDGEYEPLSAHLFALPGEKWRTLRAKLSPTFTSGKLKAMFQTLVDCGHPLHEYLGKVASADRQGKVIEVRELTAQFTTNVIASAAFGVDVNCIDRPDTPFRKFGRKAIAPTWQNAAKTLATQFFPSVFRLLRLKVVDKDVEEFFTSMVRQNMELREKGGVVRKDFFQLLVQLRNGGVQKDGEWEAVKTAEGAEQLLSLDECAAQSFIFFMAGFETSSMTVSFTLYEMAMNPECQRRVQAEIEEVLGKHNGEITYDSVSEMKYLDWCFDETLRKFPALPILNRQCLRDWHIPNSNIVVDAGTNLFLPINALQMDADYYPEPERFLPERFNPEHELFSTQRPYLPFGDGPRNCIGLRFAKMQSKMALIYMLRDFSYELTGNTLKPLVMHPASLLLSPVGGVQLRVTHRKK